MKKLEILMEEYKIANEAYLQSFNETLSVLKFYTSIILVVLGVIILKDTHAELPQKLLKYIFLILLIVGTIAIAIQIQITNRRTRNIKRLNYLRNKIFEKKLGHEEMDKYNSLTKYKVDKQKFITMSTIGPIVYYISTIILILIIIYQSYLGSL
jgi:hypothetical protein